MDQVLTPQRKSIAVRGFQMLVIGVMSVQLPAANCSKAYEMFLSSRSSFHCNWRRASCIPFLGIVISMFVHGVTT